MEMGITREKALGLTQADHEKIDKMVVAINAVLEVKFSQDDVEAIDISALSIEGECGVVINRRMTNALSLRYPKWNVEYVINSILGRFIRFS